jgi:signal peptidase II
MMLKRAMALVPVCVALDQWIKQLVESRLEMEQLLPLLPFLGLYRTWNEGIAFSMFSNVSDAALIAMTTLIIGFVSYLWWRAPRASLWSQLGFALVISGALGNLIDRALLGYVIDYVLFHTPVWSFAVFNLADVFISIGAALILLQEFIDWRKAPA